MKEALYKTLLCTVEDVSACAVLDFGFFHHERKTVEAHRHIQPELHVCIEGSYRLENVKGDAFLDMKAGSVVLVGGGYWHSTVVIGESAQEYTLRLELSEIKDKAGKKPLFSALSARLSKGEGFISLALPRALSLLSSIQGELESRTVGGYAAAETYFRLLTVDALRALLTESESEGEKATGTDAEIDRKESLENLLQQEYANPDFSVTLLAESLGFSVRQVNRLFLLFYGQSFRDVLSELRLYNAQRLLLRTSLPMAEIALRVGYREPSGFYTAFRKRFSMSPRQYRIQNGIE